MKTDPAERINFTWYLTLVFIAIVLICSIAAAVKLDTEDKARRGAGRSPREGPRAGFLFCGGGGDGRRGSPS